MQTNKTKNSKSRRVVAGVAIATAIAGGGVNVVPSANALGGYSTEYSCIFNEEEIDELTHKLIREAGGDPDNTEGFGLSDKEIEAVFEKLDAIDSGEHPEYCKERFAGSKWGRGNQEPEYAGPGFVEEIPTGEGSSPISGVAVPALDTGTSAYYFKFLQSQNELTGGSAGMISDFKGYSKSTPVKDATFYIQSSENKKFVPVSDNMKKLFFLNWTIGNNIDSNNGLTETVKKLLRDAGYEGDFGASRPEIDGRDFAISKEDRQKDYPLYEEVPLTTADYVMSQLYAVNSIVADISGNSSTQQHNGQSLPEGEDSWTQYDLKNIKERIENNRDDVSEDELNLQRAIFHALEKTSLDKAENSDLMIHTVEPKDTLTHFESLDQAMGYVNGFGYVVNLTEQNAPEPTAENLYDPSDSDKHDPGYESTETTPGTAVDIEQTGDKELPDGTKFGTPDKTPDGWDVKVDEKTGKVTVTPPKDAKPGDKGEFTVPVTYPDGSKDNADVVVTVKDKGDDTGDGDKGDGSGDGDNTGGNDGDNTPGDNTGDGDKDNGSGDGDNTGNTGDNTGRNDGDNTGGNNTPGDNTGDNTNRPDFSGLPNDDNGKGTENGDGNDGGDKSDNSDKPSGAKVVDNGNKQSGNTGSGGTGNGGVKGGFKPVAPANPSRVNQAPTAPSGFAPITGPGVGTVLAGGSGAGKGAVVDTGGQVQESFWTKIANIFR